MSTVDHLGTDPSFEQSRPAELFRYGSELPFAELRIDESSLGGGAVPALPGDEIDRDGVRDRGVASVPELYADDVVAVIDDDAFEECQYVTAINVDEENNTFRSIDGLLYLKNGKELLICPCGKTGEVNIPQGVNHIRNGFNGCASITSVTIPDSVFDINRSFNECISLTSVTIPDSTFMVLFSFNGCDSLMSVTMSGELMIVGESFGSCGSLESLAISDRTGFAYDCFTDGTSLDLVTVQGRSDPAITDYEALLMSMPGITAFTVDSGSAVELEKIAGSGTVTKMIFTSVSVNADMEGLTFKDSSGMVISDSSSLAGKTFVVDPDDRTVWNQVSSPAQGNDDLVLYGGMIAAVIAIVGVAAIFLVRRH